jgi:hypothetical protein
LEVRASNFCLDFLFKNLLVALVTVHKKSLLCERLVVACLLLSCESLNSIGASMLDEFGCLLFLCIELLDKLGCLCASLLDKLGPMLIETNKGKLPTKVSFQLHFHFFGP